jgi:hypothetical protein
MPEGNMVFEFREVLISLKARFPRAGLLLPITKDPER